MKRRGSRKRLGKRQTMRQKKRREFVAGVKYHSHYIGKHPTGTFKNPVRVCVLL